MWDLSSLIRDWTHAPLLEAWNLSHCTAREVPICPILISELDSLHHHLRSSHTNLCTFPQSSSSCPPQAPCSCCFSVWNAHHLDFIELSCFIYSPLTCHLLGKSSMTTRLHITLLSSIPAAGISTYNSTIILFTYLFFVSVTEICTPWGKWEMLFWIPVPGKWHKVGAW